MLSDKISSNLFLEYFNDKLEKVIEGIKNSFIIYYGKEYSNKINKIIRDLNLFFIIKNPSNYEIYNKIETIEEIIKKDLENLRKSISNLENIDDEKLVNLILFDPNLEKKNSDMIIKCRYNILKLSFYNLLKIKKRNNINTNIILTQFLNGSKNNNDIINSYSQYMCNYNVSGATIYDLDFPLIYMSFGPNGNTSLQGLIHEINHCLMKENIYIDEYGNKHYVSGIYDIGSKENKIINEIINEYITRDVMNIFQSNYCDFDKNLFNSDFGSVYVSADKIYNSLIANVYEMLKPVIKNNIINGNPILIKKIINITNQNDFSSLNKVYKELVYEIYQEVQETGKKSSEIFKEKTRQINLKNLEDYYNYYYNNISLSYKKFLQDREEQINYVDNLIKEGKAYRLSYKK